MQGTDKNIAAKQKMTQVCFVVEKAKQRGRHPWRRSLWRMLWTVLALFLVLGGVSCGVRSTREYFAYGQAPFCAEIEGSANGMRVVARIEYHPGGEASVTYSSPAALAGVTLVRGAAGDVNVLCGSLTLPLPAGCGAAVLAPLLLFLPEAQPERVERIPASAAPEGLSVSSGTQLLRLAFSEGVRLYLEERQLRPLGVESPDAALWVVWWDAAP